LQNEKNVKEAALLWLGLNTMMAFDDNDMPYDIIDAYGRLIRTAALSIQTLLNSLKSNQF
jgi:hypothetical protein